MKPLTPIAFLIEKAQEAVNDTAQKLAHAVNQYQQSEQKLQTLTSYCQDYQTRFDQQQTQGIHLDQIKNFQHFLAKLHQALQQQERDLQFWQQHMNNAKKDWQNAQSKLKSYQTLQTRDAQKQLTKDNKQQQKQNDEFATLSYARAQQKN